MLSAGDIGPRWILACWLSRNRIPIVMMASESESRRMMSAGSAHGTSVTACSVNK